MFIDKFDILNTDNNYKLNKVNEYFNNSANCILRGINTKVVMNSKVYDILEVFIDMMIFRIFVDINDNVHDSEVIYGECNDVDNFLKLRERKNKLKNINQFTYIDYKI